jgi:ferredoxin
MSASSPTDRPALRVDRVACSGHGVCASLLPGSVRLDEWGYPVVLDQAAERLARAGIKVVQDRCVMVEHRLAG